MRNTIFLWMTSSILAVGLSSTLNAAMLVGNETASPFGDLNQNATDAQTIFCSTAIAAPALQFPS